MILLSASFSYVVFFDLTTWRFMGKAIFIFNIGSNEQLRRVVQFEWMTSRAIYYFW